MGPNVNIKIPKKSFYTVEERSYFNTQLKHKQKTELCKNWVLYNKCYFKEECSFAHGEQELRLKLNIDKYKTKICKSFIEKMFCCYGHRCQYLHIITYKKINNYYIYFNYCLVNFFENLQSRCFELIPSIQQI